jgi:hypothetical protein
VAVKKISHHHCHSAWQRTVLWLLYRKTGIMETDWATGVKGDTAIAKMVRDTGRVHLEDPVVDRSHHASHLVCHIISFHYTTNYTVFLSHLLISLALSETAY